MHACIIMKVPTDQRIKLNWKIHLEKSCRELGIKT